MIGVGIAAFFVVVFVALAIIEQKLGRLVRIGLAIHENLKELLELQKKTEGSRTNSASSEQAPLTLPPPMPVAIPKPKEEPEVYRID